MNRFAFACSMCVILVLIAAGCRGRDGGSDDGTTTAPGSTASASPLDGENAAPAAGVTHASLTRDGLLRTYRLFVPEGLPEGAVPLVIGLHGGLGSGDQFAENSHFEDEAREGGFLAVFPDGVNRTWNGGNCCGQAVTKRVDDVGFLAALIEHLAATLPVDRDRVFMTGHSNGGIMSFRFGCERPELVAAVASVAGSLEIPRCEPSAGTSLLAIHGDADQSHPLEGGEGPRSIAGVGFVSQARSLELWTAGMQCGADVQRESAGALTTTTWGGCRDGSTARLIVVAGADHPWPGGVGGRPEAQARTSRAIDATATIWAFFENVD